MTQILESMYLNNYVQITHKDVSIVIRSEKILSVKIVQQIQSFQCQQSKTCDIIEMNLRYLLIVFAVIVLSIFSKAPDIQASTIPNYPILLINLYHPQCHRCKSAQKQLSALHKLSENRKYQVAEINCAKQTEFCDSLKTAYPKVYLYVQGHLIMYQGKITAQELDKWLQSSIELELPTLTQDQLKEKEGKQSFLLVGGLNVSEKIQIGITKYARYTGIEFYQIQSTKKIFSLYVTDQQKKIDLEFPLNPKIFSFELFHRTRDHIMSVDKPEYLEYFRKQKDFDQHMILYDHHDKMSVDAQPVLDKLCFQLAVVVACFRVDKQSPYYQEVVGNFRPYTNKSSLIYSKKEKQKAYIYPDQQFEQKSFKSFLKDAKGKTRIPDYDYVNQAHDRMKYQYVTKIDDQQHQQVIKNHTFVFVQYYSPFLENCTSFVPSYDAVGKYFKEHQPSILIAAVDADDELTLSDKQGVSNYPAFKVFVGGEGFHYKGERTTENIIHFITNIIRTRLPKITSTKDIKKKYVGISGIEQNKFLHALAYFYKDLPIYQIDEGKQFEITYFNQDVKVREYTDQPRIKQIVSWIEEQADPILVSLGDSKVPKKLQNALKKNKLILGLINKNKQGSVDHQINFLTSYCEDKTEFVCGIANQGEDDYQHLIQWIGDKDEHFNRLVVLNVGKEKCYIYQGDLKTLDDAHLNDFMNGIKNGTVSEHQRPRRISQQSLQQDEVYDYKQESSGHEEANTSDQL